MLPEIESCYWLFYHNDIVSRLLLQSLYRYTNRYNPYQSHTIKWNFPILTPGNNTKDHGTLLLLTDQTHTVTHVTFWPTRSLKHQRSTRSLERITSFHPQYYFCWTTTPEPTYPTALIPTGWAEFPSSDSRRKGGYLSHHGAPELMIFLVNLKMLLELWYTHNVLAF